MIRKNIIQHGSSLIQWLMLSIALFMTFEVFQHFNPGAMSYDSFAILAQARSGVYSDAHPPLMAFIWSITERIVPGPLGILLINLLLFYGGLLLIFLFVAKFYGLISIPLFIVVGLYPPVTAILGATWIDITMAAFFVCAIGLFVAMRLYNRPSYYRLKVAAIFSSLFILAGLSMRHNGAAAALPLFCFIVHFSSTSTDYSPLRIIRSIILGTLLTILCFFGIKQAYTLVTDTKNHLWRASAIYDIAGVSFYQGIYLFDSSVMEKNKKVDIDTLYSPRSYIPLIIGEQAHPLPGDTKKYGNKVELNLQNPDLNKRLFENWVLVIKNYPLSYLKHRYYFFSSLITRSPWGLWSTIYDWIPANNMGIPEKQSKDSKYFSYVRKMTQTVIFVPAYYLSFSLLAVAPATYYSIKKKSLPLALSAVLYISGIFHMIGLFFFAVSGDNRYSHWMILTTVIATSILFLEILSFYLDKIKKITRQFFV